jgi:hypothetical protein
VADDNAISSATLGTSLSAMGVPLEDRPVRDQPWKGKYCSHLYGKHRKAFLSLTSPNRLYMDSKLSYGFSAFVLCSLLVLKRYLILFRAKIIPVSIKPT